MADPNPHRLRLSNQIMTAMIDHARGSAQREICGLLGGDGRTVQTYYPVENIAENPAREYLMEPRQQIDAMRRMRESGETLLAIFHSHPASDARPSPTDLAMAEYPDTIYIIAGPAGGQMELNAYYYDGTGFSPVEIDIPNHE